MEAEVEAEVEAGRLPLLLPNSLLLPNPLQHQRPPRFLLLPPRLVVLRASSVGACIGAPSVDGAMTAPPTGRMFVARSGRVSWRSLLRSGPREDIFFTFFLLTLT